MATCRFPFAHDADACDCRPDPVTITLRKVELNAAIRAEQDKRTRMALFTIFAVSVALLAWSASVGLGRTEQAYQLQSRV